MKKYLTKQTVLSVLAIMMAIMSVTMAFSNSELESLSQEHQELSQNLYDVQLVIEKLNKEKQAYLDQLCIVEKEMARQKLGLYYKNERPLAEGENLDNLIKKEKQNCIADYSTPTTGNFKPIQEGGIDAFLRANGAEFVKEAGDIFRAVGLIQKIKPEVLVCIAQADSSLGNALKTTNNIGNVGNNDRGNKQHYDTLEAGINAIGDVLNNQYLKGNTVIGQLSQGGRNIIGSKYSCANAPAPFKCYATSPLNWNKNIVGCLQNINQDPTINESFEFRN